MLCAIAAGGLFSFLVWNVHVSSALKWHADPTFVLAAVYRISGVVGDHLDVADSRPANCYVGLDCGVR